MCVCRCGRLALNLDITSPYWADGPWRCSAGCGSESGRGEKLNTWWLSLHTDTRPLPIFLSLSLTLTQRHTAAHIRRRHIPSLQMAIFRHAHTRSPGMSVKIICHSVQAWVGDESGNGERLKSALSHIKPADYRCDSPVPVSPSLFPQAVLY